MEVVADEVILGGVHHAILTFNHRRDLRVADAALRKRGAHDAPAVALHKRRRGECIGPRRAQAGCSARSAERQRRRIAQMLHDEVQPLLVGARMQLEYLSACQDAKSGETALGRAKALIRESAERLRGIGGQLRPAGLPAQGLAAALAGLAQRMERDHLLRVQLQIDWVSEPVDQKVRVFIFESVRELLLNVVKHAGVSSAQVRLSRMAGHRIGIRVSDSGRGFDGLKLDDHPERISGSGLADIRRRLTRLGGHWTVQTTPGKGTCFRLVVPTDTLMSGL